MRQKPSFANRANDIGWRLFRLGPETSLYQLAHGGRILRPVLYLMSAITGFYVVSALVGGPHSLSYPKDMLMLIGGLAATFVLIRAKQLPAATLMTLITLNNTASFVVAEYGSNSPTPAFFALSIVLCGLLVGGVFLRIWFLITVGSFLFSILARSNFQTAQWPSPTLWILLFAGTAWLTNLFTHEIDKLQAEANQAEAREREQLIEERTRIAREIHDTLAQGFTGVLMQLNAAEAGLNENDKRSEVHIQKARALAARSLEEARNSVWTLRPENNLESALRRFADELTAGSSISLHMTFTGKLAALPATESYELSRIGQEALTNAVRHSGASQIALSIMADEQEFAMVVTDNGRGMTSDSGGGFGIVGMKERAAKLGAVLEIQNQESGGISVMLRRTNGAS